MDKNLKNYTARVPADVWGKFKAKCALMGKSMGDVLTVLINEFLSKK